MNDIVLTKDEQYLYDVIFKQNNTVDQKINKIYDKFIRPNLKKETPNNYNYQARRDSKIRDIEDEKIAA